MIGALFFIEYSAHTHIKKKEKEMTNGVAWNIKRSIVCWSCSENLVEIITLVSILRLSVLYARTVFLVG